MLTKKYKNGFVTLDAEKFPSVAQETIDREIRNFEPVKKAVEKLYEHERRDIPMKITIDEVIAQIVAIVNIYYSAINFALNAGKHWIGVPLGE